MMVGVSLCPSAHARHDSMRISPGGGFLLLRVRWLAGGIIALLIPPLPSATKTSGISAE